MLKVLATATVFWILLYFVVADCFRQCISQLHHKFRQIHVKSLSTSYTYFAVADCFRQYISHYIKKIRQIHVISLSNCNSIFGFSYTLQSRKLSCPISGPACIMARSNGGSIGCLQQIFYNATMQLRRAAAILRSEANCLHLQTCRPVVI